LVAVFSLTCPSLQVAHASATVTKVSAVFPPLVCGQLLGLFAHLCGGDACCDLQQGKTAKKLRVEISEELGALLDRIRDRKRGYTVHSTRLVVNEHGRAMTVAAMSRRWQKVCRVAKAEGIQFRDLRAKAGTDKADSRPATSDRPSSSSGTHRWS
jgi:integrase